MRIWDIRPSKLCNKHLLGEHRELHGLWNIITIHKDNPKVGYRHHPETLRWVNETGALYHRHELLVKELQIRNMKHHSPLEYKYVKSQNWTNRKRINTIKEQIEMLKAKPCKCFI